LGEYLKLGGTKGGILTELSLRFLERDLECLGCLASVEMLKPLVGVLLLTEVLVEDLSDLGGNWWVLGSCLELKGLTNLLNCFILHPNWLVVKGVGIPAKVPAVLNLVCFDI